MSKKIWGLDEEKVKEAMVNFETEDAFEAAMMTHVLIVLYEHEEAGGQGLTEPEISKLVYERMGLDKDGNLLQ